MAQAEPWPLPVCVDVCVDRKIKTLLWVSGHCCSWLITDLKHVAHSNVCAFPPKDAQIHAPSISPHTLPTSLALSLFRTVTMVTTDWKTFHCTSCSIVISIPLYLLFLSVYLPIILYLHPVVLSDMHLFTVSVCYWPSNIHTHRVTLRPREDGASPHSQSHTSTAFSPGSPNTAGGVTC